MFSSHSFESRFCEFSLPLCHIPTKLKSAKMQTFASLSAASALFVLASASTLDTAITLNKAVDLTQRHARITNSCGYPVYLWSVVKRHGLPYRCHVHPAAGCRVRREPSQRLRYHRYFHQDVQVSSLRRSRYLTIGILLELSWSLRGKLPRHVIH